MNVKGHRNRCLSACDSIPLFSEFPKSKLILEMDLFGLMLDQEHVHHLKCVPYRLGSGVVVEEHPDLGSLQFGIPDPRHPTVKLILVVEVVVPVESVIGLLLSPIPDIVVSAVEAYIGVIRSQRLPWVMSGAVDQNSGYVPLFQNL